MDKPEFYLAPGEMNFIAQDGLFSTLLGSCIAMTLWHPQRRIGGMCHFMLPSRGGKKTLTGWDGRYADEAVQYFLTEIARQRSHPVEYEVKLFGGGNMFPCHQRAASIMDVGNRNIDAARSLMKQHGFRIQAEDVGGAGHRKIIFDLADGSVLMRRESMKVDCGKIQRTAVNLAFQ